MLQVCLWQQGFATTDPGMGLTDLSIQMFDPGTEDRQGLIWGWAAAMEGRCDAACQVSTPSGPSLTPYAYECTTQHSRYRQRLSPASSQHPGCSQKSKGLQASG